MGRGEAWLGLKDKSKKVPADWLRGLILDRVETIGDRQKAAAACGIPYNSFRRLLKKSPRDWQEEQRQAIVKGLGISKKDYAEAWAKYAQ